MCRSIQKEREWLKEAMRAGAGALWAQVQGEREIHEREGNWRGLEGFGALELRKYLHWKQSRMGERK